MQFGKVRVFFAFMHQVNVETSAFGIPPADIALDGVYATPLSPALIVLVWDILALNFRYFIFPSFIFLTLRQFSPWLVQ